MLRHAIDVCPDDLDLLRAKLDEVSDSGAQILSVMWQPARIRTTNRRLWCGGSFVIVSASRSRTSRIDFSDSTIRS